VKRQGGNGDDFEGRLLAHLKAHVAERDEAANQRAAAEAAAPPPVWRRRGPRLALAGVAALAAVVVALIVTAGGSRSSTAFAVEPQPGGGVKIKIYSLEDAAGLEAALKEAGIRSQVTWLDAGMVCREPHYKPSEVHPPGGGALGGMTMGGPGAITISVGPTPHSRAGEFRRGEISHEEFQASLASMANLNLDPKAFRADQSVVISGAPVPYNGDPEGGSITKVGVAEGPVEPCRPVPAPPSGEGSPFELTPEGGPGYTPRGDGSSPGAVVTALHQAARAAESAGGRPDAPKPGEFLYTKTKVVQLEGWLPKGDGKGSKDHPRYFVPINDPLARYALVPVTKEVWLAPSGKEHVRETLGKAKFVSPEDQRAWEAAGSPPPWAFDPAEHHVTRDGSGRLHKEFSRTAFRGRHEIAYMERLSKLPSEPEALRLAIEHRPAAGAPVKASPATSVRGGATVERLLQILAEPLTAPAVRAAAFEAIAEIPGVGFEADVAGAAGRRGDAIGWTRGEGFGRRFIFDPRTSKILADAEMIFDAKAARYPNVPDGTVFLEHAELDNGLVDAIH
jgi:hypothetical protein